MIEIVEPGIATTVQDHGRPGLAHLGVTASGAVDPGLLDLLNRLLGNAFGAAGLETCGNVTIRALSPLVLTTSAEPAPVVLRSGDSYTVRPDGRRLWHYLAVRGGVLADVVLGSRSRDTLASIGPPPLHAGDRLAIGAEPDAPLVTDIAPLADPSSEARWSVGPRADWLDDSWQEALSATSWTITATSRVGVRLSGAPLRRRIAGELPSEGLVRGAIQAPPDGDLVMMLADHPTTGGYPVVAVVHPDDVATVAQHPPGATIRFRRRPTT